MFHAATASGTSLRPLVFHAAMGSSTITAPICKFPLFTIFHHELHLEIIRCSNMDCPVCDSKLTAGTEPVQFRPQIYQTDENLKASLLEINQSLNELKVVMKEQKEEQERTNKTVE